MVVEALPAIIAARVVLGWRALTGATLFPGIGHRPRRPSDEVWVRLALPIGVPKPVILWDRLLHPRGEYRRRLWALAGVHAALDPHHSHRPHRHLRQSFRPCTGRPVFRLGYSLGVAGAIGNFIDRLIFGRVTDFIDFRFWPVFNLADTSIFFGALLLCWGIFTDRERTGEKGPPPADESTDSHAGSRLGASASMSFSRPSMGCRPGLLPSGSSRKARSW